MSADTHAPTPDHGTAGVAEAEARMSGPVAWEPPAPATAPAAAPFDPRQAMRPAVSADPGPVIHPGQPHPHAPQPGYAPQAPRPQQAQPHYNPAQAAPQPGYVPQAQQQVPWHASAPLPHQHPQSPQGYAQHNLHRPPQPGYAQPMHTQPAQPYAQQPPMALPPIPDAVPAPKTSLLSRLRPAKATKADRAPAAATNDASDSGFRRGLLMGALGGVVLTFAGMQLLGGGTPEPASVSPAPYPNLTQAVPDDAPQPTVGETFLDNALTQSAAKSGQ